MIAQGNAAAIPLPDQSVHCVMTSPPYWGLRKYAGEQGEEPLGLESTPERHIERIVEICREIRRVLRDDGVFWLNYGDCYSAAGWESNRRSVVGQGSFDTADRKSGKQPGMAAGNLMLMPHRVALALQQDGWIIRQDLVWSKRNPMPESVNGWRFQGETCECKRGRAEEEIAKHIERTGANRRMAFQDLKNSGLYDPDPDCPNCRGSGRTDDLELRRGSWRHTRAHEYVFMLTKKIGYWSNQEAVREGNSEGSGRNPRSVLDIPTAPYKGAHYATFPPKLIAPLIRATCPRWACPRCGQGWAAVVEQSYRNDTTTDGRPAKGNHREDVGQAKMASGERTRLISDTLGHRPTCDHPHTQEEAVSGIVFDLFVGSGTTVMVAQQLLRRGIGIDISMEYLDQQAKVRARLGTPSSALEELPLFSQVPLQLD